MSFCNWIGHHNWGSWQRSDFCCQIKLWVQWQALVKWAMLAVFSSQGAQVASVSSILICSSPSPDMSPVWESIQICVWILLWRSCSLKWILPLTLVLATFLRLDLVINTPPLLKYLLIWLLSLVLSSFSPLLFLWFLA